MSIKSIQDVGLNDIRMDGGDTGVSAALIGGLDRGVGGTRRHESIVRFLVVWIYSGQKWGIWNWLFIGEWI